MEEHTVKKKNGMLIKENGRLFFLVFLTFLVFLVSISIGRYPVSINSLAEALYAQITGAKMDTAQLALVRVRIPRTLLAMIVGASLSLSGAVYQGLFKNPVVSPDLLGASNGASFGDALAILVGMSSAGIQTSAFLGGICAVGLVAVMNRIVSKRSNTVVNLILCGMLVSSLFNAAVSFIKFVADTDTKLPAITFWLMGSIASTVLSDLKVFWLFLSACIILMISRWKMVVFDTTFVPWEAFWMKSGIIHQWN